MHIPEIYVCHFFVTAGFLLGLNFANEEFGSRLKEHGLSGLLFREGLIAEEVRHSDSVGREYVEYDILLIPRILLEHWIGQFANLR